MQFLFLILLTLFSSTVFSQGKMKSYHGVEAATVAAVLATFHISPLEIDDAFSEAVLKEYIKNLDYDKSSFTNTDIETLGFFKHRFDDELSPSVETGYFSQPRVDAAYGVYMVYIHGVYENERRVGEILNKGFDTSINEEINTDVDYKDIKFANSEDELVERWRKKLKAQYISRIANGNEEEEAVIEDMKDFYSDYFAKLENFSEYDVMEVYLSAVAKIHDPHTDYFSKEYYESYMDMLQLNLKGIGASIGRKNRYIVLPEILKGGSAHEAKQRGELKDGDTVLAIAEGKVSDINSSEFVSTFRMFSDDAIKLIKGDEGTYVTFKITRDGEGETLVQLERRNIVRAEQRASFDENLYKKEKILQIELDSFYKNDELEISCDKDIKKILEDHSDAKGVILDLRSNGGGRLDAAIDLIGLFVKEGTPAVGQYSIDTRTLQVKSNYFRTSNKKVYSGPMIVLTNRGSASASEIVAGALQDLNRAIIVGDDQTFGKGSIQMPISVSQFSHNLTAVFDPGEDYNDYDIRNEHNEDEDLLGGMKFTTGYFYRITGQPNQFDGVGSDIELASSYLPGLTMERDREYALKPKPIKAASYREESDLSPALISDLRANSVQRQSSKEFSSYKRVTEELEQSRKVIPLNLKAYESKLEQRVKLIEELDSVGNVRGEEGLIIMKELIEALK